MAFTETKADFIDTDDFGESITWTPHGGTAATITAVVNDDFPNQEDHSRGTRWAIAEVEVFASDVSGLTINDIFTFRGEDWEFSPSGWQRHGGFLTLNLVRMLT